MVDIIYIYNIYIYIYYSPHARTHSRTKPTE